MPSSRRRAKKRRNETDAAWSRYARMVASDAEALDEPSADLKCRCCEGPADWIHRADGSGWCGGLSCQTADESRRLVTRTRDEEMIAFRLDMTEEHFPAAVSRAGEASCESMGRT